MHIQVTQVLLQRKKQPDSAFSLLHLESHPFLSNTLGCLRSNLSYQLSHLLRTCRLRKLVGICMKMLLLPPVHPYWPPHKPDSLPLVGSEEERNNIAAEATFTEGSVGKSTGRGANFLQASSLFLVLQRLQVSRQGQTGMAALDWSLGLLITAELRASWKLLLCYVRCI